MPSNFNELTFDDALRIARGCTDYGGGHVSNPEHYAIYQHGILTVINALTGASKTGLSDKQTAALHAMGVDAAEYQRGYNAAHAAVSKQIRVQAQKFTHKKTGKIYRRIAHGIDCTNSRDGLLVVIYCSEDAGDEIYVREANEFLDKFEEVKGGE